MSWKKALVFLTVVVAAAMLAVVWWIFSYDYDRFKPLIVEQVRAATGRDLTIEGDLHLKIGMAPALTTGPVKLRNADWGSQPDMLTIKELELQINLPALFSREIVLQRLILTKPVVLVEKKADGSRSNWKFEKPSGKHPPSPQTESGRYRVQLREVDIQDGTLIIRNRKTGKAARITIAKLTLEQQGGTLPFKAELEGSYEKKTFSLKGSIGLLRDLFDPGKDWGFNLTAKADRTDLTIAGRLHQQPGAKPLRLEAQITGSRLDVRPWLAGSPGKGTPPRDPKRVFPTTPLPFDALHVMDLRVELNIQELLTPHIALKQVKAPIQIQDGRLEAGPAKATAGGGDYQAHLQIDTRTKPPKIKSNLKIDQMNAEQMLKELGLSDIMEGVLDVQADFEGQGRTVAEVMGSLNGYATLISGKGRLGKLFFGLFDEGVAKQLVTLINPMEKRSPTTPIDCLVIRFDSSKGLAELSQMIWVTSDSIMVGGGHIDLGTEKMDIGIQPTPRRGKITLGALTKPFRLGGTLKEPALRIDPAATVMTAGEIAEGLLFGPLSIAMAFSDIGAKEGNPCVAAVEAAKKGIPHEEKGFRENIGDKLRFWRKD